MPMAFHSGDAAASPDAPWYALYTRHQHEKAVAETLAGKGFEVFLPLYSAAHRWQDRVKRLSLPLFPGYVFLRAALDRRMDARATPGVIHFVPADRPISIAPAEIDSLRQLIARRAAVQPHPFLKAGDWVRIKTGPLEGIEGILTHWKGGHRLVLSVELLQRSTAVEIDPFNVERAPRQDTALTKYVC
jgi:transcription antitermination factor NusG